MLWRNCQQNSSVGDPNRAVALFANHSGYATPTTRSRFNLLGIIVENIGADVERASAWSNLAKLSTSQGCIIGALSKTWSGCHPELLSPEKLGARSVCHCLCSNSADLTFVRQRRWQTYVSAYDPLGRWEAALSAESVLRLIGGGGCPLHFLKTCDLLWVNQLVKRRLPQSTMTLNLTNLPRWCSCWGVKYASMGIKVLRQIRQEVFRPVGDDTSLWIPCPPKPVWMQCCQNLLATRVLVCCGQ